MRPHRSQPARHALLRLAAIAMLGCNGGSCEPAVLVSPAPPGPSAAPPGPPLAASLHEEIVRIPVVRDGRTLSLEATIYRPDGPGPHPLLVLSHGSPRRIADRRRRQRYVDQARWFVGRGFAVVIPMREGFGRSEGDFAETFGPCSAPDFVHAGEAAALDIAAAVAFMRREPYVDPSRLLLAGHSAGGHASLAYAASQPAGLYGVVSFAGGRGAYADDVNCSVPRLVESTALFGRTTRVPTLWIYAENDHFFPPATARAMFDAFRAGDPDTELVSLPPWARDGHTLFTSPEAMPLWTPKVEAFLRRVGL